MNIKMIWANLGVADLARTTKFYTQLGFKPNGNSNELTSFRVGDSDFIIHFFIKEKLSENTGGKIADLKNGSEVVFSLSCDTREEIEEWRKIVIKAGGEIYDGPKQFQKGYTFGFSDPDGHKFNFLYWPE